LAPNGFRPVIDAQIPAGAVGVGGIGAGSEFALIVVGFASINTYVVRRRVTDKPERRWLTMITWTWAAGMAWVQFALFGAVFAAGLMVTIYLFLAGVALLIPAVCLPVWFVGKIWSDRSIPWALLAGASSLALGGWTFVTGGGLAGALVLATPGVLSVLAAREIASIDYSAA
jgi:hypothetical protein